MKTRIKSENITIGTISIFLEYILVIYVIYTRYHVFAGQQYIYYVAIGLVQFLALFFILNKRVVDRKELFLLGTAVYMIMVTAIGRGICSDCFVAASAVEYIKKIFF